MANRSYFRSVLNDNFKILTWLLILFIAITPNFIFMQSANAANLGGWSVGTPNYVGNGSFYYPASKTTKINGNPVNKTSGFTVPVSPARVAKVLAGGVGAVALAEAVTMLIGAGIDWVLDPANNRIVYGDSSGAVDPASRPDLQYTYGCYSNQASVCNSKTYATPQAVGQLAAIAYSANNGGNTVLNGCNLSPSGSSYTCVLEHKDGRTSPFPVTKVANPAYDSAAEKEEDQRKSIPLEAVAAQVISNADSHSNADQRRAAVATVQAAAQDIVNEAENDASKRRPFVNEMERGASTSTSETATGSATTRPSENTGEQTTTPAAPPTDIALEFPVFCGWAPIVCEAAQEAIIFPQTVADYVADFWSFVREEADSENGEVTVYEDTNIIFDDSQRVNFANSCPASEQFSVSFFGSSQNLEFSYEPLCNFMSMIKPFVVAGSYLIGAYIVMGLSRGSAD